MKIKGSTFLVTGGASGLGGATAELLVARGANVLMMDMNEALGNAKAKELGSQAAFVQTDVTSEEEVNHAIELAVQKWGDIHGCINCAGVGAPSKVVSKKGPHDLDKFEFVIKVNLIGTFNVLRLVANRMARQPAHADGERGVFINVASVAYQDGQIGQASYSAAKAGIVGMTLPIARELASHGIRVNVIAPGLFETPMLMALPDKALKSLANSVPFPKRLGKPAEFAILAAQIVENTMLNGETIRLDGSIRMAAM